MTVNIGDFLELKGDLIYLKKLDPEYIEEYWENFKDSSIESMIFTGSTLQFSRANIERFLESISNDRSRIDFLICLKESDKIVGEVVINDMDMGNRSANFRILINKKENFNKGYGSEAMLLALNYGFGMLNLHRIELEAFPYNERAIHVYEKIGFVREGIRRDGCFFNHKYYDVITMSILEEDFREKYKLNIGFLDEFTK